MAAGLSKTDHYLISKFLFNLIEQSSYRQCGNEDEALGGFLSFAKSKGYELFDRKSIVRLHESTE